MNFPLNQLPVPKTDFLSQLLNGGMDVPNSPMSLDYVSPQNLSTLAELDKLTASSLSPSGGFQWNNPYKFTPWSAGAGTTFGGKLGSFVGNNMPLIGAGFNILTGGLQAYTGLKGISAAEAALKQQKKEFNINLTNQTQAYNTEMGDRIAGRHYNSEAERQAALAAAQLVDRSKYGKGG